ncbi:MAG: hypothetical protein U0T78_01745 [Cloacibacterium normanense]
MPQIKQLKTFENISGRGILGEIDGKKLFLGNIHYLKENHFSISENLLQKAPNSRNETNTVSYLTIDGKQLLFLAF